MNRRNIKIEWQVVGLWLLLALFGWMNIYAASVKDPGISIFNLEYNYGKQFLWLLVAGGLALVIALIDAKLTEFLSYAAYAVCILLLLLTLGLAREVNGARAWLDIGPFKLQAAEFAKIGTAMALARYMSRYTFSLKRSTDMAVVLGIIGLPMLLILLQPDAGSALVFLAFGLVLFREGLSPAVLVFGIAALVFGVLALILDKYYLVGSIVVLGGLSWWFIYRRRSVVAHLLAVTAFCTFTLSVDFVVRNVLKPHQSTRILALFNPYTDPLGTGWNITQSKIAIGSGGFLGKGFLQGTQTKFEFVPQQDTDFIFCTVGEEYGWVGSIILLVVLFLLIARVLHMAEHAKTKFARIYGYSVGSILFLHVAINIGMAIGIAPVIGIPLPFFSYGGSSMLGFTALLFILVNLHAHRVNILAGGR